MSLPHSLRGRGAVAVAAVSLLLGSFGTSACNLITGADDLLIASDDDDDASGSSSSNGSSSGSGGMGSSGVGGSSTSTSSSSSSSGSGGTGLSGQGGDGAGPVACEYPPGPYGVGQGQTVPPNLSWQGYAPNSNSVSTITSDDFFDCDGLRGIDAVLIDTSQFG